MALTPRGFVPYAHVADVSRSIAFYEKIGFTLDNAFTPPGESGPVWAALESGVAQLMVARASEPVVPSAQGVLFYAYFDDIVAVHAEMAASGIVVGPLTPRFYAPKGEFRFEDPDGYTIMAIHT